MNNQKLKPTNFKKSQKLFAVMAGISTILLLLLYWHLFDLRPIADDYCSASTSHSGPFAAALKYFSNVNGDLWSMFLYSLFVGTPLLIFGTAIGSAIPQFVLLFGIVYLTILGIKLVFPHYKMEVFEKYLLCSCVLLSWFQFWMLPRAGNLSLLFEFQGNLRLMSESVLHWKTVQITYLFVPISFAISILLVRRFFKPSVLKNTALGIIFVLLGLSGYIFAITSCLTLVFVALTRKFDTHISRLKVLALSLAILLGVCISFFSPGSVARKEALANYPNLKISVFESFSNAFLTAVSMVANLGVVSSVISGFIIGYLLSLSSNSLNENFVRDLRRMLLYFLIASFIIASVANHRVGWSAWHMLLPFSINWLYWLTVGLSLSLKGSVRLHFSAPKLAILLLIFVLGSFESTKIATQSVSLRLIAWEAGPAPTAGIEDREVDWVQSCIKSRIFG